MVIGLKKLKPPQLSIRDLYNKKDKVLLMRNSRGIGDILNCRILFTQFKKLAPDINLTFACFKEYRELVIDHPCLDNVVDSKTVKKEDYIISYDISRCCILHESSALNNNNKHRADIWAEHCGITLESYNMSLPFINNQKMTDCYLKLKQTRLLSFDKYNKNGPSVLFSPLAYEQLRSLTKEQLFGTVKFLREKGLFVYAIHDNKVPLLEQLDVPILTGNSLAEWMGYIHAADYVISVDTSTFHYAGGIKKPLVGIFTHVDGKLRGKHYDFVLVQKHRDNGDWPCGGPCYNYLYCTHPNCTSPVVGPNNQRYALDLRPCLTELTVDEIKKGIDEMLKKWSI